MKYIPQLDGIRACAILAVFLYHSPLHFKGGWAGVDLFFVLSGFLITRILVSHREMPIGQYFGTFYMRRARRILPPYLALMVLASVLFWIFLASILVHVFWSNEFSEGWTSCAQYALVFSGRGAILSFLAFRRALCSSRKAALGCCMSYSRRAAS